MVEPHTEGGDPGHEELYFVARGRAKFTIDGETFDAPEGTYVFIPDPDSHRHAIAEKAGTTVLSFGGPPTFQPSAWEWGFRAEALKDDPVRAREVLEEGFREHPENKAMFYWLARLEARSGNTDAAIGALATAVDGRPDLVEEARGDKAFASLRDDSRFDEVTGST